MKTIFRGELFHLSRSAVLILALAILIVCDLFLSSRSKVDEAHMYELSELPGSGAFVNYFMDRNSGPAGAAMQMRTPKVKGQPETAVLQDEPGTVYENLIDVYWACSPYYFRWILASNKGLLAIPLIFVLVFLARDFPNRVFCDSLYIGKRRRDVFWGKTLFYFLLAFLVSLAGILLLTIVYAGGVFRLLPGGYVWSRMLLHALMDACLMAVPFLLAFILRKTILTGFVTLVYCLLIRYTAAIWPATLKADMSVWAQGTFPLTMIVAGLVLLVVCVGLSRLLFEKRDMA